MSGWRLRLMIGTVITAMTAVLTAPWLLYAVGLAKIDGRPIPAQVDATREDIDGLWKTLRLQRPVRIDPLSPYSYALLRGNDRAQVAAHAAWRIARLYNADHLADRQGLTWHLSGAALTIWLTHNWTEDELIAKAVELEKAVANRTASPGG